MSLVYSPIIKTDVTEKYVNNITEMNKEEYANNIFGTVNMECPLKCNYKPQPSEHKLYEHTKSQSYAIRQMAFDMSDRTVAHTNAHTKVVDLSDTMPPIYDVYNNSSSVADAVTAILSAELTLKSGQNVYVSRKFIRSFIDDNDSISYALIKMVHYKEKKRIYMENEYDGPEIMDDKDKIKQLYNYPDNVVNINNGNLIALMSILDMGHPVIFSLTIYDSFKITNINFEMPIPNVDKEKELGKCVFVIVGYNETTQLFKVRNSQGESWGDNGYFYMPFRVVNLQNNNCDPITCDFHALYHLIDPVRQCEKIMNEVNCLLNKSTDFEESIQPYNLLLKKLTHELHDATKSEQTIKQMEMAIFVIGQNYDQIKKDTTQLKDIIANRNYEIKHYGVKY